MSTQNNEVIVIDVKMHFWSMVAFMVKWAIASIPAFLILAVLLSIVLGILQGFPGYWHQKIFRM